MKINSQGKIWDTLACVVQKLNNYKKVETGITVPVYNCSPVKTKDGEIKNTYIEVGFLYLLSAVKDDSQGFVYFVCRERINYDGENKLQCKVVPEKISDKIFATNNTYIAQIYNAQTRIFLHKESGIEWHLSPNQVLFTELKEAFDYIDKCKSGEIKIN